MKDGSTLPGWPLYLRREWAAAYLGMSATTLDSEAKAGRVPAPIPTTSSLKSWYRPDLEAWAEDRRAAAAGHNAPNPFD